MTFYKSLASVCLPKSNITVEQLTIRGTDWVMTTGMSGTETRLYCRCLWSIEGKVIPVVEQQQSHVLKKSSSGKVFHSIKVIN